MVSREGGCFAEKKVVSREGAMGREAERLAEGVIGLRERSNCLAMSGASRAI